jgi:hypothetical protein
MEFFCAESNEVWSPIHAGRLPAAQWPYISFLNACPPLNLEYRAGRTRALAPQIGKRVS